MNKKDKLFSYIDIALQQLYINDRYLINHEPSVHERNGAHYVGERAIVFRFAHYLQNLISEDKDFCLLNLDCEYNRNGDDPKRLPSFPRGVFPDLIIHQRGSNDNNLLVMEFKTYWNHNQEEDFLKIQELVDKNGIYQFKYGIAVLIEREGAKYTMFT